MNAVYQLRITLKNIKPPIWRQVQVPMDFRLDQLHTLIQLVMGWFDYHLHEFEFPKATRGSQRNRRFGPLDFMDGFDDGEAENESQVTIGEICPRVDDKLVYTYDFGDDWIHEIKVQKILTAQPGEHYPLCLKGKRACPPEDCGGAWGYEHLLVVMSDPSDEEHEDLLEWVGEGFDPEDFDLEAVARDLREVDWT